MTLHDEILQAVDSAVRDAAFAAETACTQNRDFAASGAQVQSGIRVQACGADAECTVTTADSQPALPMRDMYGIVRRIQPSRPRRAKKAGTVNMQTLMQNAQRAMETEFERSLDAQFPGGMMP